MQNHFSPVQWIFTLRAPCCISSLLPTLLLSPTFIFTYTKNPNPLLPHTDSGSIYSCRCSRSFRFHPLRHTQIPSSPSSLPALP